MSTSMVIDTDCSDLFDVSPSGITAIGSRIEGAFMCDSGAMQWYASLPHARVSLRDSVPIGPLPQCPALQVWRRHFGVLAVDWGASRDL